MGLRLVTVYKEMAFERLKLLAGDVETLQNIDQQLTQLHEEMLRDFEPRLSRLELLLSEMERRGNGFFEETIRIGRIRSLMDSEAIRRSFEKEVIADTPQRIEEEVGTIIDWIVERNLKAWQDIQGYIDRRQLDRYRDGMVGEVGQSFSYNRQALLGSVGRVAREVVSGYDREAESRTIANQVQALEQSFLPDGIDYYAPLLHDDYKSIIDYLPPEAVVVFDDWQVLEPPADDGSDPEFVLLDEEFHIRLAHAATDPLAAAEHDDAVVDL